MQLHFSVNKNDKYPSVFKILVLATHINNIKAISSRYYLNELILIIPRTRFAVLSL